VLLFDEFDSIIGYAGAGSDSGSQAINAVAGLFKQEMNNLIDHNPNVIVVATTNFPDSIDASLVRSGRFDVKLEIPRPDAGGRAQILARMMRGLIAGLERQDFRLFADDIDLDELARHTDGMVGADLRELLRRAQLSKAMQEARTGQSGGPIRQSELLAIVRELKVRLSQCPMSRSPASTMPLSYAKITTCARSRSPSLVRTLDTCDLTVAAPMRSSSHISALLDPRAIATTTSRSRSVRRPSRLDTDALAPRRWAKRPMRRRVMDGASSAPPPATVRTAATSSAGGMSLSTKPLAPARNAR
jgi:SpoVK/Ycf46/Vps4 family AAA+-type ATPase